MQCADMLIKCLFSSWFIYSNECDCILIPTESRICFISSLSKTCCFCFVLSPICLSVDTLSLYSACSLYQRSDPHNIKNTTT